MLPGAVPAQEKVRSTQSCHFPLSEHPEEGMEMVKGQEEEEPCEEQLGALGGD